MRLIDATKAIESIDEIAFSMSVCISTDYCHGMTAMKDAAIHAVERQPTVDAVPVVHGKWIWDEMLGEYRCSECDRITRDTHDEIKVWEGHKAFALVLPYYCGFCGAKMDGKEQSDG